MIFGRRPCAGCEARDSEIQFLRNMLSGARTIVREPDVVHVENPAKETVREVPIPTGAEVFARNPIEHSDWTVLVEGPERATVGTDVESLHSDVVSWNEERRARIAARRGGEN